ncbi:hypothetical protein IW140_004884 [Coemansia sp. RSA 1813]|nr:hypothetical protein EV178_002237 [Coemansia sp. RSA 1646]KAJ1770179.1 hypothetical protein LPJ74_003402 [Coemansia sp. RSA 1843]KAJ2089997.1 hypothetical protein IW138_002966 [Coemansia sp. RSA 986]KAJ2217042.1 hypothetical protein EV179_000809 [Coemansia sp. RSA 487]KAJ2566558.1 hypothetical protein IW140_004884 [Coemansia sp. RSA 1813]
MSNPFSIRSLLNTGDPHESKGSPRASVTPSTGTASTNSPLAGMMFDPTASPADLQAATHRPNGMSFLPLRQLPTIDEPTSRSEDTSLVSFGRLAYPTHAITVAQSIPAAAVDSPTPPPLNGSSTPTALPQEHQHRQRQQQQQQHYYNRQQHLQEFHQMHHSPRGGDYRFWPYPQPQQVYHQPPPAAAPAQPPPPHYNMPYTPPATGAAIYVPPHGYALTQQRPPPPHPFHLTHTSLVARTMPLMPHPSQATTPWRRERRSKACLRCHTKKIKCEGEGSICDGCKQAGSECKWVEMKKRGPKPRLRSKPKPKLKTMGNNDASAVAPVAVPDSHNGTMRNSVSSTTLVSQQDTPVASSVDSTSETTLLSSISPLRSPGSADQVTSAPTDQAIPATVFAEAAAALTKTTLATTETMVAVSGAPDSAIAQTPAVAGAAARQTMTASVEPAAANTASGHRVLSSPDASAPATAAKTAADATQTTKQLTSEDFPTMESVLRAFHSPSVAEDTRLAVIYYFDYMYARIPIFHPATLVRRIVLGQVDPLLIDAIKASTARVINQKTGQSLDPEQITNSVRERLLRGLDSPTVDYVQAVVLTAAVLGGQSKFIAYNSLTCLASSLVTRLGWHTLDLEKRHDDAVSWDEWVALELKRRTFWAVYQLDSYQSLLADRPMTIDASRIYVMVPGSDPTWDDVTVPQILHWPTRHQKIVQKGVLIRTAALSYTFVELCSMLAIVARMNEFFWKVRVHVTVSIRGTTQATDLKYLNAPPMPQLDSPNDTVQSLFEYSEFEGLHQMLTKWRNGLVRAEEMKPHECTSMTDFSQFGSTENRRYAMRIRYFSLRCYSTAIMLLLHFANRPSFFDPQYQRPRNMSSLFGSVAVGDSEEDKVLRAMMSIAFSEMLNDGILFYDVVPESWALCVQETYDLMDHLDKNSDIPIDRCDASISFCLFTSITVLIRNVRFCRQKTEQLEQDTATAASSPSVDEEAEPTEHRQQQQKYQRLQEAARLKEELFKSASTLRRMWNMLKNLGFIWTIEGMEQLLRTMQVEEIANASDLFSNLSL